MVTPADHVPGPQQGRWTYNDYAALPDDGHRYEIVDGVLYMSPSPNEPHQTTTGRLFRSLSTYIEDAGLGRVYFGPLDIELERGTIVQPDVFIILNTHRERITFSRIVGAPDLAIEVSSPGTVGFDRYQKRMAYARAGVPEYWIADPWSRTIEVLSLEAGSYRSLGVFEGKAVLPTKIVPDFLVHVEQFFL
jgi:Uma2 family endonuclease